MGILKFKEKLGLASKPNKDGLRTIKYTSKLHSHDPEEGPFYVSTTICPFGKESDAIKKEDQIRYNIKPEVVNVGARGCCSCKYHIKTQGKEVICSHP